MISFIIVSNRENNLRRLGENIGMSVGIEFQLIHTEELARGIGDAYNRAAATARFPYLCFVHDDVLFHTIGWGKKMITHLETGGTGFIGAMGSQYKSLFGTSWNDGEISMHRYNVMNGANQGHHLLYNPGQRKTDEVVCVDGAFLCCRKEIWQQYRFDGETFKNFHFYDLDICLQAFRGGLKNYVVYDIMVEHFSVGKKDWDFLEEYFRFVEKWKGGLPVQVAGLTGIRHSQLEGYALTETIRLAKRNGRFDWRMKSLILHYFSRYTNLYQLLRIGYYSLARQFKS